MARPVAPARPTGAARGPGAARVAGVLSEALVRLAAGTPLAGTVSRLDARRVRHPRAFIAAAVALVGATSLALVLGGSGLLAPAVAGQANRSALDAFVAGTVPSPGGAATPGAASASALLGGAIDPIDLIVKGGLVIVLLVVTLRVLRRVQGGSLPADARIRVIESRPLGAKTQLHLVAIGDRQVLIGATPGRLVTLAELSADEIEAGLER